MIISTSSGEMLGKKLHKAAQASLKTVIKPALEAGAKQIVKGALIGLTGASSEEGKTSFSILCDDPSGYEHRDLIVEACLKLLPIDIGCRVAATDGMRREFLLMFEVVEAYTGGYVQYDFPVFHTVLGMSRHNLSHLKSLDLEGDALVAVDAFEIILQGSYLDHMSLAAAMEWGLAHPQEICGLVKVDDFFKQFDIAREEMPIEVEPYS